MIKNVDTNVDAIIQNVISVTPRRRMECKDNNINTIINNIIESFILPVYTVI